VAEVGIPTAQGTMPGYLARPAGAGPAPGVLVLFEAFGSTPEMRAHADRLAAAGYLALVPDLYFWGAKVRCFMATLVATRRRSGRAIDDIEAARAWLAASEECTGKVGIVGFCMGGSLALACAPGGGYAAAAPNYGEVPSDAERVLEGICPVVASFASRDRYLRGHADRLRTALEALGVPHDVKEYEGATHGFMNPHPNLAAKLNALFLPLHYDPAAADDAWARILTFFDDHVRSSP